MRAENISFESYIIFPKIYPIMSCIYEMEITFNFKFQDFNDLIFSTCMLFCCCIVRRIPYRIQLKTFFLSFYKQHKSFPHLPRRKFNFQAFQTKIECNLKCIRKFSVVKTWRDCCSLNINIHAWSLKNIYMNFLDVQEIKDLHLFKLLKFKNSSEIELKFHQ